MSLIAIRFTPILPKGKLFDATRFDGELRGALKHWGALARDDFMKTTRTWNHAVPFKNETRSLGGGGMMQVVDTNDRIYRYVVKGTRPHLIPRSGRIGKTTLSWRASTAKTRPRVISSYPRRVSGPRFFARWVRHPGTLARDFDYEIAKRRARNFANLVQNAVRVSTGH